jgi:hypothetical protein
MRIVFSFLECLIFQPYLTTELQLLIGGRCILLQVPVSLLRDVWVLHPEHPGVRVACRKAGVSWKTSKAKNPTNIYCDIGQQMVHIERVFLNDVTPMYTGRPVLSIVTL